MATFRDMTCRDDQRRALVYAHGTLNGIDYIEVVTEPDANNQRVLRVFFIEKAEDNLAGIASLNTMLSDLDGDTVNVKIEGGVRIADVKVLQVVHVPGGAGLRPHLAIRVDQPGDFSTYTLGIDDPRLDPPFTSCDFNFKVGCPTRSDCKTGEVCPAEPRVEPLIDYLAKDYASFRRALLDLIPTLAPDWTERLEADLGITLLELLAYVADYLSYYQDAVANEFCLQRARQRISVRRHARLIDYHVHDGASARTVVFFQVASSGLELREGTPILSRIDVPLGARQPPIPVVIGADLVQSALTATGAVFETMHAVTVHQELNEVEIYTWDNRQCCLPRGTTTVDLRGDLTSQISTGTLLLLEEVLGPETGLAADADPAHRQLVRVTEVSTRQDPLHDPAVILTRICWDDADALTFPLCVSAVTSDNLQIDNVSVVRGNLALADHGRTLKNERHAGPRTPPHERQRLAHRFRLREGPLSFRVPLPGDNGSMAPAAAFLQMDPRQAEAQVTSLAVTGTIASIAWEPVAPDLLSSRRFDHNFVVETDNDRRAHLRFGDNVYGLAPPDGSEISVTYRVGLGAAGNVGYHALAHVVDRNGRLSSLGIELVRNPLAAWGGFEPQSIDEVKQVAPAAFHAEQLRAVTEADYARTAEKHPQIDHAVATFRWTGSWYTVFLNLDPVGRAGLPEDVKQSVHDFVLGFTQAGYDLELKPPIYVALDVEIDICVDRGHFRADVEADLQRVLSNRQFADGLRGLFHPDNFTFNQSMYLSRLVSAVESVEGVDSAVVRRFIRQDEDDPEAADPALNRPATRRNRDRGYIAVGRLEVIRLDNDPNFAENGTLKLNMLGGK